MGAVKMDKWPDAMFFALCREFGHRRSVAPFGVERYKRLAGFAIFHQFDGPEYTQASDVTHTGVSLSQIIQFWLDHIPSQSTGIFDNAFFLENAY